MAKMTHKSPSKMRYEKANPSVTVRVSRELYNDLDEVRKLSGKSFADILRDGASRNKPLVKESYQRGYDKGQSDAQDELQFCWYCGQDFKDENMGSICCGCLIRLEPEFFEDIAPFVAKGVEPGSA